MRSRKWAVVAVLVGHASLVLVAAAWWLANLGTRPAYGDTDQYLSLADSLRVDDFRTLFYPLVLRGLAAVAAFAGCGIDPLVGVLQTLLALAALAYLGRALWDVSVATARFRDVQDVPAWGRRTVIGAFAAVVFAQPLVNHYALSVMTDSLAATFSTAAVGALIRLAALGDVRLRTVLVGGLTIAAAGFMRAEKVYMLGAAIAAAIAVAWWLARSSEPGHRRRVLGCLIAWLLIPGAAVTGVNRATQVPGLYGWPPDTAELRLFIRTVWPRLGAIRPLLSPEFQAEVSAQDAAAFDGNYVELFSLVPRLQRRAGGTNRLVNEASRAAIRHHGPEIVGTTAADALRYALPLLAYPADLCFGDHTRASSWTHTRMQAATPALTSAYLWVATGVLLLIQLPVVSALLIQRAGAAHPRVAIAVGLLLSACFINAVLYAAGNGFQNVRYALPAVYLLAAGIAWGNLVWLGSKREKGGRSFRVDRLGSKSVNSEATSPTLPACAAPRQSGASAPHSIRGDLINLTHRRRQHCLVPVSARMLSARSAVDVASGPCRHTPGRRPADRGSAHCAGRLLHVPEWRRTVSRRRPGMLHRPVELRHPVPLQQRRVAERRRQLHVW